MSSDRKLNGAKKPIRATIQFYKVSDTANLQSEDVSNIAETINRVYEDGDFVGSLVDGTLQLGELKRGQARPTQPAPLKDPVLGPPVDIFDGIVVKPLHSDHIDKSI